MLYSPSCAAPSIRPFSFVVFAALLWTLLPNQRATADLTFDVSYTPGVMALPDAMGVMSNVEMATGGYATVFKDDTIVTVKVELDSEALDVDLGTSPSVFGAALISYESHSYTDVAMAMTGDAKSSDDVDSLALLQSGPFLEALTHDTSLAPGDSGLGPGGSSPEIRLGSLAAGTTGAKAEATWNSTLKVSRANSKALGLPVTVDGEPDIRLVINDEAVPGFDFDRGDGITPGSFDFLAVAAHEIGHGLGFVSGVDDVDFAGIGGMPPTAAPDNPLDLSDMAIFSVLDLFRTNVDTRDPGIDLGQPTDGFVLDWRFGPPPGPFSKPFFSLDAAEVDPSDKVPFSTGTETGDGFQASHWADGPFGLLIPDLDPGIILDLSPTDVVAFDVIGWDTVSGPVIPEPSSLTIAFLGFAAFLARFVFRR